MSNKALNLSDADIVKYLSEGCKVKEISKETGINNRTLEKRIELIRKVASAKTAAHLVAKYKDLGLI